MIRPDLSAAPSAESELERRLRALPKAPGPDPRFRNELRVQLVAAAERAPELTHAVDPRVRVAGAHRAAPQRIRLPFGRPFSFPVPGRRAYAFLGATMAVLLVISGTTYWLAQRALPGDALYGLKRAGESVDLSTKQGDQSRGDTYLSISTTRIDEAAALVNRSSSAGVAGPADVHTGFSAGGPLSAYVDGLVRGVLVAGDAAAVTATRLLTSASVAKRASHPAAAVTGWLTDQRTKVKTLVARLPETGPATAGAAARTLQRDLHAIQTRITLLTAGLGCRTCQFATSDRFGPLPCPVCPRPVRTPPPTRPATPTPLPLSVTSVPSVSPTLPPLPTLSPLPTTGSGTSDPTPLPPTPASTTTPPPPPTTGVPTTVPPPPPPTTPPPTTTPTDSPTAPQTSSAPSDGSTPGPAAPTQAPVS